MRTSGIMLVSIAGFGFALWLARGGETPAPAARTATTVPAASVAPASLPRFGVGGNGAVAASADDKAAPAKLDPRSDAFRNRLDEQIPSRLYGEAARCYKGGLPRDQRLDLTYRIHVADGAVSFGDVRVGESTLSDSSLERCIREKITSAKWRDDSLPDLDEDDNLYMRVAGFATRLANADDDSPSSAMN